MNLHNFRSSLTSHPSVTITPIFHPHNQQHQHNGTNKNGAGAGKRKSAPFRSIPKASADVTVQMEPVDLSVKSSNLIEAKAASVMLSLPHGHPLLNNNNNHNNNNNNDDSVVDLSMKRESSASPGSNVSRETPPQDPFSFEHVSQLASIQERLQLQQPHILTPELVRSLSLMTANNRGQHFVSSSEPHHHLPTSSSSVCSEYNDSLKRRKVHRCEAGSSPGVYSTNI